MAVAGARGLRASHQCHTRPASHCRVYPVRGWPGRDPVRQLRKKRPERHVPAPPPARLTWRLHVQTRKCVASCLAGKVFQELS